MTALGNLNWCLEDNEDTKELQERIEQLTTEVSGGADDQQHHL